MTKVILSKILNCLNIRKTLYSVNRDNELLANNKKVIKKRMNAYELL